MAEHRLTATPETVRWGFLDAATPPALTVASGDVVVIETVSGGPDHLPPEGFAKERAAQHAAATQMQATAPYLPISPHISPYLPISPYISPYLPDAGRLPRPPP